MPPTKIFTSPFPSYPIVSTSVFTRLFTSSSPESIGHFHASLKAFIDGASGTSITRAELLHLAVSFGYGLRHHPTTHASRGDTVLIHFCQLPCMAGCAVAAGLRCTLANSAYLSHELGHQYQDSSANLVITSEEGLDVVRQMFAEIGLSKEEANKRIIVLGQDLRWAGGPAASAHPASAGLVRMEDLLGLGKLENEEKFEGPLAQETLYLCYSSGTTGKPKGVETTHQNITTILDIMSSAFPPIKTEQDAMLGILPLYHIYGAINCLFVVIQKRFDPVQFCAAVQRYRITACLLAPPVLVVLSRHEASGRTSPSTQVKTRLLSKRSGPARRNLVITQGYGLTETSPSTHMLPVQDADRKIGSIGKLLPNLEARLVRDEEEPGELWVRGKTIMKGYLNNPTATRNAITPDAWFKTGDIAVRDREGYYRIVVLLTHPEIVDCAATELPRAYVVPAHPDRMKAANAKLAFEMHVVKWMESKVARHKYLRGGVAIIDAVPKSASGKILRRELRELAKREAAQGDLALDVRARL
ncbi:AMP binding protein [Mycena amicta]|nr:AMP binding protein [Mycena amicta]